MRSETFASCAPERPRMASEASPNGMQERPRMAPRSVLEQRQEHPRMTCSSAFEEESEGHLYVRWHCRTFAGTGRLKYPSCESPNASSQLRAKSATPRG